MSKITHEELDIVDAAEENKDLAPFFEEYIFKRKRPPVWMVERLQFIMSDRSLSPRLVQNRRGPAKKQETSLWKKLNFYRFRESLRNEMSAADAHAEAAKRFAVDESTAHEWFADVNYFLMRLASDGKALDISPIDSSGNN